MLGCGRVGFDPSPPLDAREVFDAPWGEPTPISIPQSGDDPTLTGDLLELYINIASSEIHVSKRASADAPWPPPELVAELGAFTNTTPEVTADGLALYIATGRPGTLGSNDIWVATRSSRALPFDAPAHVMELNSPQADRGGTTSADGLVLVFDSQRNGGTDDDLFLATRTSTSVRWEPPVELAELNVAGFNDEAGILSPDGLRLYFDSNRSGNYELYLARRASRDEVFTTAEPIAELNSASQDVDPWISTDERRIVFYSSRLGGRLWEATR